MAKIKVGVLFGGRSAEHEVSLVSAESVMKNLDLKKYEIVPIGITHMGSWISRGDPLKYLKGKGLVELKAGNLKGRGEKQKINPAMDFRVENKIDVIFPVLHGTYGEDGTIQGFLELADIPYVGAGVAASAVGMDKVLQKEIFASSNLPIAKYLVFKRKEILPRLSISVLEQIKEKIDYPCFVKPANAGSSIGIFKAHTETELKYMIKKSAEFDRKIVVEEAIPNIQEIEVSVLGNDDPEVSVCGEIIASNEFYDYDAKYVDGKSRTIIPAKISKKISEKIRAIARTAYLAIDCAGMARVDLFLEKKSNKIYLNEVNTIPGFTSISMYPKLWEASGLSYSRLLDRLIKLALERFEEKQQNATAIQLKEKWY